MTSEEIRKDFLEFFREKDHEVVPSDSLVPADDPTLLFTNAGMNQFKDVFLGTGTRPYLRAVDTQKCLRVSGKHNDLEEVGVDTYHHTFFEMLGNWSFGDYFKREAIRWAWELMVDRWGLEPDRLYATVHEGDEKLGLDADTEAADFWKSETGINPDHVLFCGSKDNFWMMGDTGPCGPCSEVHIDLRSDAERKQLPGRELVNKDDPRVMEIWNLVFIQYNAHGDGTLDPLKDQHVDTGMGFERMVAVLQDKKSNYDTDLFSTILAAIAETTPLEEVRGYDDIASEDEAQVERIRIAMRVVADHIRTIAFAIADGVTPGNVGRGYVIRRILRRAVRFGYQALAIREPFLYRLIEPLAGKMGGQFAELIQRRAYIERVTRAEEESFLETLGLGIGFFERIVPYVDRLASNGNRPDVLKELRADRQTLDLLNKAYSDTEKTDEIIASFAGVAGGRSMPGEVAFLLHDTYGFPVDLTQLMAREVDMSVDMKRYNELMSEQKGRARAAATFVLEHGTGDTWHEVTGGDHSHFRGYDELEVDGASIRSYRSVEIPDGGTVVEIVLDQTPFYAESGGQVGDAGELIIGDEVITVADTVKIDGRYVHLADRVPKALDAPVTARVEGERRVRVMKNHTATHLLHAALREILGPHVQQKGSLVAPDRLRFDFSHFERVTPEELRTIARRVNEVIQDNVAQQEERNVPFQEALDRGAMALFGEKYGDTVRMITFDPSYSVELCGGTHVDATGQIGMFQFVHEGSVAAGIRRVEALTGLDALAFVTEHFNELERVRGQFKSLQRPADEEVAALLDRYKAAEKELARARADALAGQLSEIIAQAEQVDRVRVARGRVEVPDMDALRTLGQTLRDKLGDGGVGVLGAVDGTGEKVYLVAAVTDDLTSAVQAGALVGKLAKIVGGGGGGRPQLATAGGKDPSRLDEALASVPSLVREMLG